MPPLRALSCTALLLLLPALLLAQALPKQPTLPLKIGKEAIVAEVVASPMATSRGLMFREKLGTNEGMLFVFASPGRRSFYMKNTSIPLSVAYVDAKGVILEIVDLQPFDEEPVPSKSDQVQYVLEMNRDWFSARDIKPGAKIENLGRLKL